MATTTTPAKREPLRPRSTNTAAAPVAARRGPASAEKESPGPKKNLGHEKDEKKLTATTELLKPAVAPPPPPPLQLRMKDESSSSSEATVFVGPRGRDLLPPPASSSYEAWDLSGSESAPASSWAILPNRALLCRPLPLDVGRCTCVIAREAAADARGVALYSLYTNEGQGRQDRKLAVARHGRRRGRSEFVVAQNQDGVFCTSDKNFLGTVAANLVGSKYQIWGQGNRVDELKSQSKRLLGVVAFAPTITTLTGSFRSIRAWVPKNQSMQLKTNNSAQIQHISGLPKDWQEKKSRADQLCSRAPFYNNMTKRYELDFRERAGRMGYKVQTSVKNFQMTLEENGRQTVLQLGRVGKSKYIMDFRYPLTGYQALCICLASIDSKLCCTM
ncbi:tubby-like protein 4 isoform X2 [Phragmites australis]|uniref:tubby-like protein 4 isoform X2 n=1 Tax=Phragmites australis TaxID=29695 RepID=UPI002D78B59C|nr:tubby-like protein 4 isoform X2 [Phragmites australis]